MMIKTRRNDSTTEKRRCVTTTDNFQDTLFIHTFLKRLTSTSGAVTAHNRCNKMTERLIVKRLPASNVTHQAEILV